MVLSGDVDSLENFLDLGFARGGLLAIIVLICGDEHEPKSMKRPRMNLDGNTYNESLALGLISMHHSDVDVPAALVIENVRADLANLLRRAEAI